MVFPNQYMAKINSHTKSQTGIVAILFSYFRVGVDDDDNYKVTTRSALFAFNDIFSYYASFLPAIESSLIYAPFHVFHLA